jgi:hypothetical protein
VWRGAVSHGEVKSVIFNQCVPEPIRLILTGGRMREATYSSLSCSKTAALVLRRRERLRKVHPLCLFVFFFALFIQLVKALIVGLQLATTLPDNGNGAAATAVGIHFGIVGTIVQCAIFHDQNQMF